MKKGVDKARKGEYITQADSRGRELGRRSKKKI